MVDIVTYGDDSDLESVNSLDGCDSDEEVIHADNISTLQAQVRATASEQMLFQRKIIFLQKTYRVYNLYKHCLVLEFLLIH